MIERDARVAQLAQARLPGPRQARVQPVEVLAPAPGCEHLEQDELVADAGRNRIVLARGAAFSADHGAANAHVRFNVAACETPRVADYLRERLAAIARWGQVFRPGSGSTSRDPDTGSGVKA
jgi:hypothetical protein